ncbi:hypothetical protein MRB53_042230 [Persea americana]|nr:hypothetical protein MRB53_042230 [Persea americana]
MTPDKKSTSTPSESTPLLRQQHTKDDVPPETHIPHKWRLCSYPWQFSVVLLCIMITVLGTGAFLAMAPLRRLYESVLCQRYYSVEQPGLFSNGTIPEAMCKLDAIQDEVVTLFGYQDAFENLPGLVMAVPMGILADRFGRKPVLLTALSTGITTQVVLVLISMYAASMRSKH